MADKALVVLSGGQDSTTCLYWAMDKFGEDNVSSVTFDYGQRHRVELECVRQISAYTGVENTMLPIDTFNALGGNALTDAEVSVDDQQADDASLPNTFVPGRNLIFLTYAAALAFDRGIGNLVTGVAQTDYSGYPDCREATIAALQHAICLSMDTELTIHTPLMHLSKKDTVLLAVELGALPAMAMTHTCYNGERPPCGHCPACVLRARGFADAGIDDPIFESA